MTSFVWNGVPAARPHRAKTQRGTPPPPPPIHFYPNTCFCSYADMKYSGREPTKKAEGGDLIGISFTQNTFPVPWVVWFRVWMWFWLLNLWTIRKLLLIKLCEMVLTSQPLGEILMCDHSDESSAFLWYCMRWFFSMTIQDAPELFHFSSGNLVKFPLLTD